MRGLSNVPTENATIAIVDDDQSLREALRRMLVSYGFNVLNFASAQEFLAAAPGDGISCMILDIRMPGMTGLALQEHLTARGNDIPTVLITACPTAGERERALANGAISYLAKPVNEEILLDTIR